MLISLMGRQILFFGKKMGKNIIVNQGLMGIVHEGKRLFDV